MKNSKSERENLKLYTEISAEAQGIEKELKRLSEQVYTVSKGALYGVFAGKAGKAGKSKRISSGDFTGVLVTLLDLEKMYEQKLVKLAELQKEIELSIEEMPPLIRAILRAKYLQNMTWERVAEEVGYSVCQVQRIEKRAWENTEAVNKRHNTGTVKTTL